MFILFIEKVEKCPTNKKLQTSLYLLFKINCNGKYVSLKNINHPITRGKMDKVQKKIMQYTFRKKGAKTVLCPVVWNPSALEPSKRVPENPRTIWGTFKGSIVCTRNL